MNRRVSALAALVLFVAAEALSAQNEATSLRYNSWRRDTPMSMGAWSPNTWLRMDTVSTWVVIPGPPAEIFRKARYVYGTMKLKVQLADSTGGVMGNPGFNHTGALAGRRMSSWVSCGEGLTGPNADTWRITMAVLSSVEPAGKDSTRLRSIVVATAKNLAEGSSIPMACSTTGQMEHQIHQKVAALPPAPSGSE